MFSQQNLSKNFDTVVSTFVRLFMSYENAVSSILEKFSALKLAKKKYLTSHGKKLQNINLILLQITLLCENPSKIKLKNFKSEAIANRCVAIGVQLGLM